MSGLEVGASVLLAIWMGLLSLAVVLLIRQLGLVTVRLDRLLGEASAFDQGLEVGSLLPPVISDGAPGTLSGVKYVLVVEASCEPCRAVVERLGDLPAERMRQIVTILRGSDQSAQHMSAHLPPESIVLRDPAAAEAVESLKVGVTPFVFETEGGQITQKAALQSFEHLETIIRRRSDLEPGRLSVVEEVHTNGR